MGVPFWAIEMAARFWQDAGGAEDAPRSLRRAIANALPLTVVLLPALRLAGIDVWLRSQRIVCRLDVHDRPLRACLVARYGQGIVFLDGADPDDEQRVSLAHEVAHFLKEYWTPRHRAAERLGPHVLEVLDGDRAPRHEERVQALLAQVPIGYHVHLLDRCPDGQYATPDIASAEYAADVLAYELLAPSSAVLDAVGALPTVQQREAASALLRDVYRLPAAAATRYAALLLHQEDHSGSFLRQLGLRP